MKLDANIATADHPEKAMLLSVLEGGGKDVPIRLHPAQDAVRNGTYLVPHADVVSVLVIVHSLRLVELGHTGVRHRQNVLDELPVVLEDFWVERFQLVPEFGLHGTGIDWLGGKHLSQVVTDYRHLIGKHGPTALRTK